ncbi:MAG: hypothetical protein E7560_01140 [Ruminococcaceae bacterium]|nr:hypothetical protein [Oscillospiraceae bacterium]
MSFLKYAAIVLLALSSFIIVIFSILSGKPIKTLFFNSFLGVFVLLMINLTSKFSGIYIPYNYFSVIGASVFGIPGVCLLLIFQILFSNF